MTGGDSAFDLAIIGGGPGGYGAAIRAAQLGIKTALIEKDKVGGVCLHRGCIPTKVLLHAADLYVRFLRAKEFGITVDKAEINYAQLHRRKEDVVARLFHGVQFLLKKNRVEVFHGEGYIISPNSVLVKKNGTDVNRIITKNIILATGSVPLIPGNIPHDSKYVLTSNDILVWEEIPKSIVIAGGGAIGVEFAHLLNILGAKVTILEFFTDILPAGDKEISSTLKRIFNNRGIETQTSASLEKVTVGNGVTAEIKRKDEIIPPPATRGNQEFIKADYLLLALGRNPALADIGLEKLSLTYQGKYLQTNKVMETSQKGVFAIGDITGPPLLAHKAVKQGLLAVSHLAGKETAPINYQNIPAVTYCSPQVASMGLTQEEAVKRGYKTRIGKFPFLANSKAIIDGESEEGFLKIIADDKYGEILGMHAIGPNVGELMWGMSLSAILEGTAIELTNAIFPHPTLSEAILEAAHAVIDRPIHM
ncbi:MAG: dihydrolipoyl dehydrogenase [Candidatus Brocadia sp.]|uniref:Dihydrolipoyl dehydrogenase n=1 Tax=Candidatus Brocadia fulgida TaxID=380242 RepID=A0A0M2USV1_9BACT|nr:MAG: dihydrolipoamide dehydrogenase [Candidatus Brocadia fulgida]UJS21392.1 MAG: dihydrolipoyl dehydrogenase [Candidatus Brocadia sp.]